MKIVVIGIGKVGYVLTKQLSQEGHDIVAVDRNPSLLHASQEKLDVATVTGNGASVEVQREAGVPDADLMIAVTSSDEVNLLCSLVAHRLGCRNIVARVRNPEYDQQMSLLDTDLGLSFPINPEKSAAAEIFHLLQSPSLLRRDLFTGGRAEMVEIKVSADSVLAGKRLSQLSDILCHRAIICAVDRNGSVEIPSGNFTILAEDKVTLAAASSEIPHVIRALGIRTRKISRVMIVGGSTITVYLTEQLLRAGISVTIVEESEARCQELCAILPDATIISGNGTSQELLQEEGIREADAVVTLTGMDEENLLISMYANYVGVPKTITKINRLEYNDVLKGSGIDTIISPKLLTANVIVRYVRAMNASREGSVETLYRIVGGKAEALGFTVPESALFLNTPLADLSLQPNTLIAAIIRGQRVVIPQGTDCMRPGDSVIVIAEASRGVSNLTDIFADKEA